MKKLRFALAAVAVAALGLTGAAAAQTPVNIVYPINGGVYPIVNPPTPPLTMAYIPVSFSATCVGGPHPLQWSFDGAPPLGNTQFYDEASVQFVYKLPGGFHTLQVQSDCGFSQVQFRVGN
jgi:hypothetical protein